MSRRIQLLILYFSFFVGILACNENSSTNTKQENKRIDSLSTQEDKLPSTDTIFIPSLFELLISHMESLGYVSDSTYFDEKMYQEGKIHYVNYESHFIHEYLADKELYEGVVFETPYSPMIDSMFAKVVDIRLYPWRIPDTQEGRMRAGVVEEWSFTTEKEAELVLQFLENEQKALGFPFVKTRAYYFLGLNCLYMFHSNDSGVAYRHQQFYEWIKKEFYRNGLPVIKKKK